MFKYGGRAALFLLILLWGRAGICADPALDLWAAQGSTAPFTDPIAAPAGFEEEREPAAEPSEELKKKAGGKPFVAFAPDPLEPASPGHCPQAWEVTDEVGGFASLDEYEPFTFAVYALAAVRGLKAEATPLFLRGQFGEKIPVASMDLRTVRCLNRYMGDKKFRRSPIVLEKARAGDLPAGGVRQFWLNVHVSAEARPGLYEGVVRLAYNVVDEQQVKVRLRVLPIRLLRPPTIYGFWYPSGADWKGLYGDKATLWRQMVQKHFVQMREYGLNSLGVSSVPAVGLKGGKIACDFYREGRAEGERSDAEHPRSPGHSAFGGMPLRDEKSGLFGLGDLMQLGKETRLLSKRAPILYSGAEALRTVAAQALGAKPDDPKLEEAYAQAARAIVAEGQARGWPPFIFIPVDEMDNRQALRREAPRWLSVLRKAGITTGATLNGLWLGRDTAESETLRGLIDVRVMNFVNESALLSARRADKQVWLYNVGVSPWEPKSARLAFGLYTARCRAAGCFQWAYQFAAPPCGALSSAKGGTLNEPAPGGFAAKPGVDPYHELGSGAQFYAQSFAYPAPDGPLPTLALEAIREGIDDMRYIYTLSQLIAETQKAGRANDAEAPLGVLNALLSEIPVETPVLLAYGGAKKPAEQMQTARWQIAMSIMNLQAKMRRP